MEAPEPEHGGPYSTHRGFPRYFAARLGVSVDRSTGLVEHRNCRARVQLGLLFGKGELAPSH